MVYGLPKLSAGDTNTHPLSSSSIKASWVQLRAATGNSGTVWVGDSLTATDVGDPLGQGAADFFPPIGDGTPYDLSLIFYKMTNASDNLYVIYARK